MKRKTWERRNRGARGSWMHRSGRRDSTFIEKKWESSRETKGDQELVQ